MQVAVAIVVFVLLFVVLFVISAPLRAGVIGRRAGHGGRGQQRDELEAAREAKYREIRDTELDFRTGKLSPEDYASTDGALRAEAVEILDRLESIERRDAAETETAEARAVEQTGTRLDGEEADEAGDGARHSGREAPDSVDNARTNPEVEG
ncbi:MAG TPA: hypothetical protein VK761_04085 [Solirubrobacteraceae bacterium]|jgi:hypothetical protein|nr:hypothetical protein [Solirubrobacteraceae bacterium]